MHSLNSYVQYRALLAVIIIQESQQKQRSWAEIIQEKEQREK